MTQTEAMKLRLANDLLKYAELVEDEALISPEEMNCASLMRLAAEALAQPEQERCVGCEACIDTACGRDECPKGWPKAAQPEQEPVALRHSFDGYGYLYTDMGFGSGWIEWTKRSHKDAEPLYTTPPQRTWVGLTDEQIEAIAEEFGVGGWICDFARAIEAELKEKNDC